MSRDENGTVPPGTAVPAPASVAGAAEAVADQLAAANLSDADDLDVDDAPEPKKEETELWKPHPPTEECSVYLVALPLFYVLKAAYYVCCGMTVYSAWHEAVASVDFEFESSNLPPRPGALSSFHDAPYISNS